MRFVINIGTKHVCLIILQFTPAIESLRKSYRSGMFRKTIDQAYAVNLKFYLKNNVAIVH